MDNENKSTDKQEEINGRGSFKFISLELLIVSLLFIASLVIVILIIHEAVFENEQAFDNKIFSFFSRYTTTGLISIMKYFTFFGSSTFLIPAYIVLLMFLIAKKKFTYSLNITIIVLTSTALIFALKNITHRRRPSLPIIQGITNYSFPSGHALSAFIFFGIIAYIIWHRNLKPLPKWLYTLLLFCFAITVGISRIILRVHFPTDVIASFCFGNIWTIASLWLMRRLGRKTMTTPMTT